MEKEISNYDFVEAVKVSSGDSFSKVTSNREFNQKTAALIRDQIGDIEEVRISLGLSKRKICQLLLIDPSTWTRWATGKTPVPPHVYRSLQWGLAVMDKYPETHPLSQQQTLEALKRLKVLETEITRIKKAKGAVPEGKVSGVKPVLKLFTAFCVGALLALSLK